MKITIPFDEAQEIADNEESIATGSWRWGHTETFIFDKDGKHFRFTMRYHPEEGMQNDGSVICTEVTPVTRTITEWVAVKDEQPTAAVACKPTSP